ncbi:MAG: hypothetical protein J5562_03825 [Clostridia bacterium]|nr:hypothetical protein [Clostridia bacterium]
MRDTLKRTTALIVLVVLFAAGVVYLLFSLAVHGSDWASNRINQHLYSNGTTTNSGAIYDRNGALLVSSEDGERVYNSSRKVRVSTLHTVGDTSGFISTGTQSLYRKLLSGYNVLEGVYGIINRPAETSSVTLNIDSEACCVAYDAFGDYNGTIVVYNYKNGELVCSISKPSYDVNDVPSNLLTSKYYDGVFLDKAVSGVYTPGSVIKIITAISALQNIPGIESQTFDCDGEYEIGSGAVICNSVHYEETFEEAFNKSCNFAFADITLQLGASKLLETANSLGFNKQLYAGEVALKKSTFSPSDSDKLELGWAGIGQSTTLLNPSHLLSIVGAIANGGTGYAPNRIHSYSTFYGQYSPAANQLITLDGGVAAKMRALMRSNVVNKYGDDNFPNLEFCAKTGTAQLDDADSHSWLAGFSSRSDLPLAVVCIVENGGWGSGPATEVTNEVMQYFLDVYTNS